MNKKIKNLFLAAFVLTGLAGMTVSCNKDEINSLNDRVTKVENALADLQTQITNGAVITNVESTANGVKVTLSDGSSFTLTNGKDGVDGQDGANGQDGADGQDGSVVTIGENGNWFIDGVDTGFPSRGDKGDKGDQGDPGAPGADGEDGADAPTVYYYPGADGLFVEVTILPDGTKSEKTTDVSYLVPGVVTAVWDTESNTLTLYGVEGADEDGLVISLNATLKSLAFVPEVVKDGYGLIESLYIDEYNPQTKKWEFITSNKVQALYRANPANIDVEGIDFSFIGREVETRAAGDQEGVISGTLVDSEDGLLFDINANEVPDLDGKSYFVALKASFDNEEIVSDYAFFSQYYIAVNNLALIDGQRYAEDNTDIYAFSTTIPSYDAAPDMSIKYDEELDVKAAVLAYSNATGYQKSLEDLGFDNIEYRVTLLDKYVEPTTSVDQNACVNLSEDGVMTVKEGTSNVGKTPVVKAEAYVTLDGGKEKVLATSYIKIEVVLEIPEDKPLDPVSLVTLDFGTIEYANLTDQVQDEYSVTLTATDFNKSVLDELELTPQQFVAAYDGGLYLPEDMTNEEWIAEGILINNYVSLPDVMDWTAGNTYTFGLTNVVKYGRGPVDIALRLIPYDDTKYPVVEMHLKYNVIHDEDACWPAFDASYVVNNEAKVKGVMDNGTWVLSSALAEHFEDASEAEDIVFALPKLDADGNVDEKNGKEQTGAELSSNDINATISCSLELSADRTYVVRMTRTHANGMSHSKDYKVTFMVPFQTSVSAIQLTDSREAVSADLTKNLTVKENAGTEFVYKAGKAVANNSYGFTDASFEITTALAKGQAAVEGLTITGNTVTWENEGTLLQAPKTVNLVVSVKIDGIYASETPVSVTINPAE